jgi:hypothetical protein
MRKTWQTALAFWMVIGCPVAMLALPTVMRGDRNWLTHLVAAYPVLFPILVVTAIGPLVLVGWLCRKWM